MQKKLKIKKGDTVKVIAGAASGQQGVILDVDYSKERVFVEGLSVINKKHVKPQSDKANPDGGIIEKDRSIHISTSKSTMLYNRSVCKCFVIDHVTILMNKRHDQTMSWVYL